MEIGNHLKSLLQFQLASDTSSVTNLPYCLSTLTAECLLPSAHLAKWTSRINSLMYSKESGARWAGLCLAQKTSILSQTIMIDCAQSWLVVALPALSRNEPMPVLKAALRLMRVIFTTAIDISEFHRQVCIPNVVKFTTAILSLADSNGDPELKVLCIKTLTHLVTLYPTTHRASSSNISSFCQRYLGGTTTNRDITKAASELYSILPTTGGKVGAVNLWRKSVDETLALGWDAVLSLRTTFPAQVQGQHAQQSPVGADPVVAIPLNLDRLQCSVLILCDLLRTLIHRPVKVPFGSLVKFCFTLLSFSREDKIDGFVDPLIRSMEVAIVPELHSLGCDLLNCLAERFPHCMGSHLTGLLTTLAFQLEQKPDSRLRLKLLSSLESLLKTSYVVDSSSLLGRIAKAVLPSVVKIVSISSSGNTRPNEGLSSKTKNGKKRARNFEGDEIFKASREVICPTSEDQDILLKSINVLRCLLKNPSLTSAMRSIIGRVVTAISVALPRMPASSLSSDPHFILSLAQKVQEANLLIGCGTTSALSKALPFIIEAAHSSHAYDAQNYLELLLHPRVPPIIRLMPHVESLSLLKIEESHEEAEILSSLQRQTQEVDDSQEDVQMNDPVPDRTSREEVILQKNDTSLLTPQQPSQVYTQSRAMDTILNPKPPVEPSSSKKPIIPDSATMFPISSSIASNNQLPATTINVPQQLLQIVATPEDNSDDEEMPTINMSSDSEIDED